MRLELANMKIDINTTSISKHIPDIEIYICIIKYKARSCHHTLPFKHIPKLILVSILINCTLWLNMFPPKVGVSTSVIPPTILTGLNFDYNKHCQL